MNNKVLKNCKPQTMLRSRDEKLRITYIGYMSFVENCYKLIDQLGNDKRYILQFFGEGTEIIEEYSRKMGVKNVVTHGRFEPSETVRFIESSDIIYNLYGVGNLHVDTALSIKLYYATYMNLPILVFKGTYMEEISKKYGFGYSIDKDGFDELGDKLYNWYHSLNFSQLVKGTEKFRNEIAKSHQNLENLIDKHIVRKELLDEKLTN
jgi:hypothetical protein